MVRQFILLPLACLLLAGCNKLDLKGLVMPTNDDVDQRFIQSQAISPTLKSCTLKAPANYSFYVATDPHVNHTHRNLDIFNNTLKNDADALFGVVLGDCIDVKDNLPRYLEAFAFSTELHTLNQKVFHLLGNHDVYFNGWTDFKQLIGPSVYWFEVICNDTKDLYITLDTASGTLGSRQTRWLSDFLSAKRHHYRHCVVFTHTNIFYTDNSQHSSGNMPFEESLAFIDLLSRHNVSLVLQGHDHTPEDLTHRNVRYVTLRTLRDEESQAEYLKVKVSPSQLALESVCL